MKHFIAEKYWCVQQLNIFQDLSDSDAFYLNRILSDKALKHEERICEEGVYFIKEGRIKITEETSDNNQEKSQNRSIQAKSETKEVLETGEMFGVFSDDDRVLREGSEVLTYAECLSEVCIGIATIRDFSFYLKRKPHLTLPLHRPSLLDTFYIDRLKKQEAQLSKHNILKINKPTDCKDYNAFGNIAFRTVSSRLALLLQNLAVVPDNKGALLTPRLSSKRISRLIGTSAETLDKLFETFRQHQVIERRWGRIQILNSWQLKKIADARMKTLIPMKEAAVIPDDDIDLAAFINGQAPGTSESASTFNVK